MTEIIPVIHMVNKRQVFANVETCLRNDIKKVFLINHRVTYSLLGECALEVKDIYPIWVGANFLGVPVRDVIMLPIGLDALWSDGTLVKEDLGRRDFDGLLFTGLAFKYQPQPQDLEAACKEAVKTTDVVTTSGAGTGIAAPIDKIKTIHGYLDGHPLAIASGVSVDNILDYKDLADYLLVATSITDSKEMIISDKLKELKEML
jgi:hypothetical protein